MPDPNRRSLPICTTAKRSKITIPQPAAFLVVERECHAIHIAVAAVAVVLVRGLGLNLRFQIQTTTTTTTTTRHTSLLLACAYLIRRAACLTGSWCCAATGTRNRAATRTTKNPENRDRLETNTG